MLLEFDFGTSLFELFLCSLGSVFGDTFEDFCGSALDELLRVCKAKAGSDFADCLDDGNLISAAIREDHVEFSLLFDSFCDGSRTGNADRCSSGNAPMFFKLFNERDSFQNGELAEFFYECINISHFFILLVRYRRLQSLRRFQSNSRCSDEEPLWVQVETGAATTITSDCLLFSGRCFNFGFSSGCFDFSRCFNFGSGCCGFNFSGCCSLDFGRCRNFDFSS